MIEVLVSFSFLLGDCEWICDLDCVIRCGFFTCVGMLTWELGRCMLLGLKKFSFEMVMYNLWLIVLLTNRNVVSGYMRL